MRATGEMQVANAIEAAEEVADPLNDLVERVAADPGVPFQPDVLASLCELKREDQAAFERLRAQLKSAGCRVTELDDAIAKATGESDRGPKQADILIGLTTDIDLFPRPLPAKVTPIWRSAATARPGRSAAGDSSAGLPAATSRRPAAHRTRRPCIRR